jgi:hypothetical protein
MKVPRVTNAVLQPNCALSWFIEHHTRFGVAKPGRQVACLPNQYACISHRFDLGGLAVTVPRLLRKLLGNQRL